MEVQLPWTIAKANRSADRWRWAYGYLTNRGISPTSDFFQRPSSLTPLEQQAKKLVKFAKCKRNWATLLCESPTYMRSLFGYAMVAHVFTTNERALIVDADDFIQAVDSPDGDMRDLIEFVDLLMICHVEPDHVQFKWKRSTVANILQRRKMRKLATFLEVFVKSLPTPLPEEDRVKNCMKVVDSFGAHVYELFTGSNSKSVIVRHSKENNNGSNAQANKRRGKVKRSA